MRNRFDTQLNNLHVELIKMGALCEESIAAAMKSVLDSDEAMADRAAVTEREIDRKERDIEALCMKLLLQQQPVARDLRAISSALRMISDMERIGDQAADIAEISKFLKDCPLTGRVHLKDMAMEKGGQVMAPVMEGNMNFPRILRHLEKAGTKYILVEQDTCQESPFVCLEKSYRNVSSLGYK